MITDEQIEQLRWKLKHEINGELQENMRKEERRLTKEWLAPILAAECEPLKNEIDLLKRQLEEALNQRDAMLPPFETIGTTKIVISEVHTLEPPDFSE